MKKTLLTLGAAALIGTAGVSATPSTAHAYAWWVPVVIAGAAVGGTALAVTAAQAQQGYYYGGGNAYYVDPAPGNVYVRPAGVASQCYLARERVPGGWRRVQVCN